MQLYIAESDALRLTAAAGEHVTDHRRSRPKHGGGDRHNSGHPVNCNSRSRARRGPDALDGKFLGGPRKPPALNPQAVDAGWNQLAHAAAV